MKPRRAVWIIISFAILLEIGHFSTLRAEVYQFIGSDGVVHFTNVPTDPRYRRIRTNERFIQSIHPAVLNETIQSASKRYNVDPELIRAVIKVESDFNPQAVSRAGAMGLMQLMPETAVIHDVRDPFDPQENIQGGVEHLSGLLDRFDDNLTLALAAYHAGEKRVKQYGQVPPIEQTRRYIRKVMSAYQEYRKKATPRQKIYKVMTDQDQEIYTNNLASYQNADRFHVVDVK